MPEWDEIFGEKGHVFTEPHEDIPRIADLFIENGIRRVLDLGCGTGRHLVFFAKMGFDIYGFDSSSRAISLSEQWLKEEKLAAPLQHHQMENVFPYVDNFFDAIISIQVIHHNLLKDIKTTIQEMVRVLRPSGMIFVTFPVLSMGPVTEEVDWDLKEVEKGTYIPQMGPESGIPHHYFSTIEIPRIFRDFKILEIFIDNSNHRCILGVKR